MAKNVVNDAAALEKEAIAKDPLIRTDRLRYEKNKVPSWLCYLAIILDCLYFVLIYKTNNAFFYKFLLGVSVLVNLVFLLACFLSSEGIKNYKKVYAIVMLVLAAIQIVRIFVYPIQGVSTKIIVDGVETEETVLSVGKFIRCLIYLSGSAACLITGAVVGVIRTNKLENHLKSLNK